MRYDLPQVYLFIFAILQPFAAEVMPNQAKRRHGRNSCQPDHISACILLHRMCYLQQYLSLTCEQPEHEPWVMNAHP